MTWALKQQSIENEIGEKVGWSSISLQQRCQSFRTFVIFNNIAPILDLSENLLQSEIP